MIQKLKVLIFSASLLLVTPLALPTSVFAADTATSPDIQGNLCSGGNTLKLEGGSDCSKTTGSVTTFNDILAKVINIISVIVGVVAVIMIIIGGFRYITSGGSSEKVTAAKNTILYGIIGLVVVALAQIIVRFVLNKTTVIG